MASPPSRRQSARSQSRHGFVTAPSPDPNQTFRTVTVNVGFLKSGAQFSPPKELAGEREYKSTAQRLAEFHAKTQAAAAKAAKSA